ncbi:MAG TPA: GNAT family N-acetyltransferase [Gaiellaceae bacterium]|nr:GNAT family N-acetyltransferase [Gaiellaceae bacterium]
MSFTTRPLGSDDAQAVADMISDYDQAFADDADRMSARDVREWWSRAKVETLGVFDETGRLAGVGAFHRRGEQNLTDNFVHPSFNGRGIGTSLLEWAEERTAEQGIAAIRTATISADTSGKALIESRGYYYIRSFYRMVIDLDDQPDPPDWPEGFTMSLFEPGEEREVHATLEEAFADHWGFVPRTFEEWNERNGQLAERLCYLVRDQEGTLVAAELCDEEAFGAGHVGVLGVRPQWRRRGIAEALLRQAFHDLYARGQRRVGLGVDSENPTGATRLYGRVGMRVALQEDAYEKLLSPAG